MKLLKQKKNNYKKSTKEIKSSDTCADLKNEFHASVSDRS